MTIERVDASSLHAWHAMRPLLWPREPLDDLEEAAKMLERPHLLTIVARDGNRIAGFAEASIRRDYVNGCETSPVVFLEGIYVLPGHRKRGIARALSDAVAAWGRKAGCTEFASDALVENTDSHAMHCALGFEETERVVYFRKLL
ncbi:MAG: GNAT family N-acetyltransferase [Candidatus Eremiobacteraeota bacterium]|nr:GNAT family N-acetyltransferase [Candidatus Eremiobacteraeota bacterium]